MAAKKKATAPKTKKKAAAAKRRSPILRGPAEKVRLEHGEGDKRTFWEISRTKSTLTMRRGIYLSSGRTTVQELDSVPAAKAALIAAVEQKRSEGFSEPAPRATIGTSSRHEVSARNPEIEALIDEDPSDPQRYLVYADWLQQQGDPRGELIMVHHGLVHNTNNKELDALDTAETQLMKGYAKELLGSLAKYTHVRTNYGSSYRALAWRYGFVRAARVGNKPRPPAELTTMLFENPSARFLERLVLSAWSYDMAAMTIALAKAPPTLHTLVLGNGMGWGEIVELGPFIDALPRVRRVALVSVLHCDLKGTKTDSIEDLNVQAAGETTLESLATAKWPNLKRLDLNIISIDDNSPRFLKPVFDAMPALAHLTIRRAVGEGRDALANEVLTLAAARSLPRLDLAVKFTRQGADGLVSRAAALRAIRDLRIPNESVPNKVTRATLSTAFQGALTWIKDPEPDDFMTLDDFHHARPPENT